MTQSTLDSDQFAEFVDKAAYLPLRELRNSTLGHQEVLDELWETLDECQSANWDGCGALPVNTDTYDTAVGLIWSLPLGFPRPSVGAEPDGQLTLEWRKSPLRTLSVSVDSSGYLHYAGLYGSDKCYGSMTFFSSAPEELIRLVRKL